MKWTVRVSAKGCNAIVHRFVYAPNYSHAVQVAGEKFGEHHVIHLVYERKENPRS